MNVGTRFCPLLEFKALDDQTGVFEGYLSVFGNQDSQKDIVDAGAFSKTLQEKETKRSRLGKPYLVPILWQHKPDEPIGGFLAMTEDPKGLYVKGQLDLNIVQGQRAYSGLKMGYINGLSIGYRTIKDAYTKDSRHLKEVALNEGSVVTFPANDEANVLGVKQTVQAKAGPALDFSTVLAQLDEADDLQDNWGDASVALVQTLYGILCAAQMADQASSDPVQAVADAVDAFKDVVTKLTARSVALHFCPALDDDGDSFFDPDGPDADEQSEAVQSMADVSPQDTKAGRMLSSATCTKLSNCMEHMKSASSHIQDLLDANNKYEPGGTPTQKQSTLEPEPQGATTPDEEAALAALFSAMLADMQARKQ